MNLYWWITDESLLMNLYWWFFYWWIFTDESWLMNLDWWILTDESLLMNLYWWIFTDESLLMNLYWWIFTNESLLMKLYWWIFTDESLLMKLYWWNFTHLQYVNTLNLYFPKPFNTYRTTITYMNYLPYYIQYITRCTTWGCAQRRIILVQNSSREIIRIEVRLYIFCDLFVVNVCYPILLEFVICLLLMFVIPYCRSLWFVCC